MKDNLYIKPLSYRKIKNGNWVILANKSELLVVDETTGKSLVEEKKFIFDHDEVMSILYENGFFTHSVEDIKKLPEEKESLKWQFMKYLLFTVGLFSVFVILALVPIIGVPIGDKLISDEAPLSIIFIFIIIFSMSTSFFHELMHILYAQNWKIKFGGLDLSIRKASATVSMTHVWTWSFVGRTAAVSAGVILDLLILACFSLTQLFYDHWVIIVASSVMWLRIIWQFRFNKSCDGKIVAMMIIDNPMIDIDASNPKNKNSKSKEFKSWMRLKVVGFIVEAIILAFWIIPFLLTVFKEMII
jgi:hypothetical protein